MLDLLALREEGYGGYLRHQAAQKMDLHPQLAAEGPTVSVLVPVHEPHVGYLERAVASVCRQSYPHWQLVLADDASQQPDAVAALHALSQRDPRIVVVRSPRHLHICATTNLALAAATGTYVTFLDQDDELHPSALAHVAAAVRARPQAQLLYSDEDRLCPFGSRFLPYFKPQWSPDLLRAQNYICHLAVYRRTLLQRVGGLRVGYEGSQDHDLALRATALLPRDQIVHLPQVLYHWRTLATSTATHGAAAKPYAVRAGLQAVADAVAHVAPQARAESQRGFYQVLWPVPKTCARVHVVVHGTRAHDEAMPIDVGGAQVTLRFTRLLPQGPTQQVANAQLNAAVAHAEADVVLLLAAGPLPSATGWLARLLGFFGRAEVGCVGGKLVDAAGATQRLGYVVGGPQLVVPSHVGCPANVDGYFGRNFLCHNVAAMGRAFMAIRRADWRALGGLEEGWGTTLADADLCLRLLARGRIHVMEPGIARVLPGEGGAGDAASEPGAAAFACRHGAVLAQDPYYSPHLPLGHDSHRLLAPSYACRDAVA